MSGQWSMIQRILGSALTWGLLWLMAMALVGVVIGIVDPASIDPGDRQGALMVLGPMGILSGIAFAILSSIGRRATSPLDLSLLRAVSWGILGSAIVQLGYLNHGDMGVVANIQMALVLCGFGGVITAVWFVVARSWAGGRLVQGTRS